MYLLLYFHGSPDSSSEMISSSHGLALLPPAQLIAEYKHCDFSYIYPDSKKIIQLNSDRRDSAQENPESKWFEIQT